MSIGALLALLASPGVFLAISLLDKYSALLRYFRGQPLTVDPYPRAFADGYMLLAFSMTVTGLVTIWKWDRILPDAMDRLNLATLPISNRRIFLASLGAISIVVSVFIADVNAGSMFIYPMVVTADQSSFTPFFTLAFAHLVVLITGSLFAFCACFSIMGLLILAVPRTWFAGASIAARTLLGLTLATLLLSSSRGASWLRLTRSGEDGWYVWNPAIWFSSLYAPLIGRPDLSPPYLWQRGLIALLAALLIALAAYTIGYARSMEGLLAAPSKPFRWPVWIARWGHTPLERAVFSFTLRLLWRSERHSLTVIAATGAGIILGVWSGDMIKLPFFAGFALLAGLRMAMGSPLQPAASWPFRLLAVAQPNETARVVRRIYWVHLAALLLLPSLIWLPPQALFALILLLGMVIEGLAIDFRQIPFTVRAAGFRNTRLVYVLLGLIGLVLVPALGSGLTAWVTQQPLRAVVPLLIAGGVLAARSKIASELAGGRPPLVFEEEQAEVTRLGL
jgi:hypothetical protein